ncbi:hypothetical protein NQ318_004370 [Aromia moschata]|uniref:PPM-type phosphatase domain-containing protein n=1 Tax=Aromia moschata TaxID=1265417 RepID=A0AAV8YT91_9CUCU|nr:hypothetical protein NQ318_004370 [Aromia moschata]
MVVAGRTQQLIKSSKNVTISKKLSFSTHRPSFEYRNFLAVTRNVSGTVKNDTLARESRSTFTKLTPQERFSPSIQHSLLYKMAGNLSLSLFAIAALIAGANAGPLLESPIQLNHLQRLILAERPAEELNDLINRTLSRENVQRYVNELLGDLRQRLANEDLLDSWFKSVVHNPKTRLIQKRSTEDVESLLSLLNTLIGEDVLVLSNDTVTIDVDALGSAAVSYATVLINSQFPGNVIAQIVLVEVVKQQVELFKPVVAEALANFSIPVEDIETILSFFTGSDRRKRDLVSDLVLPIIRNILSAILTPIKEQIDSELDDLVTVLLSFYITGAAERVTEVAITIETVVDQIFSNLINGTDESSSRRRRDVGLGYEVSDFSRIDAAISRRRVRRDLVSTLLLPITTALNGLVKNIFVLILSTQYSNIGQLVMTPLRLIVNTILDAVLPCLVDTILRANEYTHEFNEGSVKSYDSNQLASNNPIEDTRSEAKCLLTTACLLPHDSLLQYMLSLAKSSDTLELIQSFNDKVQFVDDVRDIYKNSFAKFIRDLSEVGYKQHFEMQEALQKAFLKLDEDLSNEAMPKDDKPLNLKTMSVAMSGAVACVAHIDGPHLHVASVGDSCAVLGTLSETNSWLATKLTNEHNSYNQSEVDRIIKEHPYNESTSVIKMDRLLGQLAPFRAMGDFRFKWSKEVMAKVAKQFGDQIVPPGYHTPPYLTALPEVTYHRLKPRDKFLIVGTDGLWDVMTPLQAVRLVGEHMKGKVTLNPLKLPRKNMTLSEINETLLQRKEGLKMKPKDSNAATHIIRNALGGTEFGIDHVKISQLLSLPEDVVRVFRGRYHGDDSVLRFGVLEALPRLSAAPRLVHNCNCIYLDLLVAAQFCLLTIRGGRRASVEGRRVERMGWPVQLLLYIPTNMCKECLIQLIAPLRSKCNRAPSISAI